MRAAGVILIIQQNVISSAGHPGHAAIGARDQDIIDAGPAAGGTASRFPHIIDIAAGRGNLQTVGARGGRRKLIDLLDTRAGIPTGIGGAGIPDARATAGIADSVGGAATRYCYDIAAGIRRTAIGAVGSDHILDLAQVAGIIAICSMAGGNPLVIYGRVGKMRNTGMRHPIGKIGSRLIGHDRTVLPIVGARPAPPRRIRVQTRPRLRRLLFVMMTAHVVGDLMDGSEGPARLLYACQRKGVGWGA